MAEQITRYTFKEGMPVEFEILSLTDIYQKREKLFTSPHRTTFYQVLWFKKGSPDFLVDFKPMHVEPNSLLFLNKDAVQLFGPNEDFDARAIIFTDNFFCKTEADIKFLRSTMLFNDLFEVSCLKLKDIDTEFQKLIELMEQELNKGDNMFYADLLRNYLHSFLMLAERELRGQNKTEINKGPDVDYTILFKELVEAEFRHVKQVSAYASRLSVTEKRLNQATTKVLGKSPKNIIDERVILEAKRLLAHTNENIKEVGYALGFQEPTNFIKYFRKHSNLTPVEFREQFSV